jgi:hypothetical protein
MRDCYDIMKFLEYLLHDTSAAMWSDVKKLMAVNASYEQVCNRVIEAHEQWFYKTATLTKGTAVWEATPFDFPGAPAGVNKILLVTDANGDPLLPINLQQRIYGYAPGATTDSVRVVDIGYWLDHDKIWVNSGSFTGNLRIYYIRKPPRMQYGTAEAGADTTMTLDADTRPEIVDDYYNSVAFTIREGTGIGLELLPVTMWEVREFLLSISLLLLLLTLFIVLYLSYPMDIMKSWHMVPLFEP